MKLSARYVVALFPLAVVAAYTGNMFHCLRQADFHEQEVMFFDERLNPKGPSVAHQYSSGSERDGDYSRMSRHFRLAAYYREAACAYLDGILRDERVKNQAELAGLDRISRRR